jgi:serum/glucocorticoid-regulated kinase 2
MPYLVLEYDVNQVLVDALGGSDLWNPVYMHQAQLYVLILFTDLLLILVCSDVSRKAQASVQIYLRSGERGAKYSDMGDDIFMGGVKFVPNLDSLGAHDEWHEILGGDGKIKIGYSFKSHTVGPCTSTGCPLTHP